MSDPEKRTVELDRLSWGQLLDGLTCRAEQYESTAEYFRTGETDGEILEATDADEAQAIANDYREIIQKIRTQLDP
ncbi:MAG: hypothetical protein WD708_11365 [Kiritimatiellia bacterium]